MINAEINAAYSLVPTHHSHIQKTQSQLAYYIVTMYREHDKVILNKETCSCILNWKNLIVSDKCLCLTGKCEKVRR